MFACCVREVEISTAGIPPESSTIPRAGIRTKLQLNTHLELGSTAPFLPALITAVSHPQLTNSSCGKEHKEDN